LDGGCDALEAGAVSIDGLGSGASGPSGSLRSNCMKTRFQISIQASLSAMAFSSKKRRA